MKFYSRCLSLVAGVVLLYYILQTVLMYFKEPMTSGSYDDDVSEETMQVTDDGEKYHKASKKIYEWKSRIESLSTHPMKIDSHDDVGTIANVDHVQKNANDVPKTNKEITPIDKNPIVLSENICKDGSPYLIIMVPSIPSNAHIRTAIRQTYAQLSRDKINDVNGVEIPYIVRTMFLLGRGKNDFVDKNVLQENIKYNDIVQYDFIDSYRNLTLKMLHGFHWISKFCSSATYVLKSDEDVFVNVALLIKQLELHTLSIKGSVFGFIYSKSKVWRYGRWAIDKSVYNKEMLPRYASGTAYVISVNILHNIVKAAKQMQYVAVEDAFITGIIASEKLGAELVMLNGSSHINEERIDPCTFVKNGRVTTTNLKSRDLYKYWNALTSFKNECHQQRPVSKGL